MSFTVAQAQAEVEKRSRSRIMGVLSQNSDKNFVQRILKPEGKPILDLGKGNFATHKMAWTTADGKSIVYPKVIQDPNTGKLIELSGKDAVQHALKNNEFITAKNNADAEWLSSNYKKVWDINGKNIKLKDANDPEFTPEEAQAEKQRRLAAVTTPMDAIKNLLGIGETGLQIPVVAGQDLGSLVAGIPGAMPLARKITGALPENVRRGLAALSTDRVIDKPTLGARIGGGALAGLIAAELPGAALGAIPKIAELTASFPKLARIARPLLFGAGGAAISPDHRARGFLTGTALGAGLEAPGIAPEIARGATAITTRLSPNKYAKEIVKNFPKLRTAEETLGNLSGGKTLNENSRILAKDIRGSYNKFKSEDSKNFKTVIDKAGNESIYDEMKPPSKEGYRILEKWKRSPIDNYTSTLKDVHEEFMDMPTFDKAHKLQSTLGRAGSDLLKAPRSDIVQRDIGNRFLNARDRLLSDMNNHLSKIDSTGNLVSKYNYARNYHKLHVIPYEENSAIRKIAKGNVINPRNITTIFKNPEENVSKVVSDLGKPAREKIAYHELRKTAGQNTDAMKTVKAYEGLEKKGLSDYMSPKLDEQINTLKQKSAIDELIKGVGKKPTAESLLKTQEGLERKGLDIHLPPSLREQLNILRSRLARQALIRKGLMLGGAGGLGYGTYRLRHLL